MMMTSQALAKKLGADLEGDPGIKVSGVASLREAEPGDVSFVALKKYAADAADTKASVVILSRDFDRPCVAPAILRVEDPGRAFALVADLFAPPPPPRLQGIHPTSVIAAGACLGDGVAVGPYCVIEDGAHIGDGTCLHAFTYIGFEVRVGAGCCFYPHVSVRERCRIGDRVIVHNGVVIGSDGFGYEVNEKGERTKIPQTGIVEIGDDVEIGANVTIDRARFGRTRIGKGVKIDNLVQIGHNVVVGDHAVLVAQVGVAGSTEIGPHCILAGQVGVAGHIRIGEGSMIGAQGGVVNDVPPRSVLAGSPAVPKMDIARALAVNLPELKRSFVALRKRVEALEAKLPNA